MNSERNKVWKLAKNLNETWRSRYECKFGLQWYALGPKFNNFKCNLPYQLENNQEFDTSLMTNGYDIFLGYDSMCKSHFSIINEGKIFL